MALDTNKLTPAAPDPLKVTSTTPRLTYLEPNLTFEVREEDTEEPEEPSKRPNGPVHNLAPKRAWHPGTKRARTHLVNTMVREATKLGITRRRLEELAALEGVHENTIRRWLTGHQYPKPRSIRPIIARLKGMSKVVPAKAKAPKKVWPAGMELAEVVTAFSKLSPEDRKALVELLS